MYLKTLHLTNFRNYAEQSFELEPGRVLLLGENAQGKTNVLEAISLLATGRSERASVDADFIAWDVRGDKQPFARVVGVAQRGENDVTVEIVVAGRPGSRGMIGTKKFKLNGVAKRAADVVGNVLAVLFTTDDMELVRGAPSGRRRFLDVMLSQADRSYARALSAFNKVVTQRNALLKRLQEGAGKRDELAYWDDEMAMHGAVLVLGRGGAMNELSGWAAEQHARLSGEREELAVAYVPKFADGWDAARIASASPEEIEEAMKQRLQAGQARDIAAGLTISGPHRDDLALTLGDQPAAAFASRGQQRTAALALRLAEARFLRERSGEQPIVLLDDVLSELDEARRGSVLDGIDADQVFISSPDPDRFPKRWASKSQMWMVVGGAADRA